MFRSDRDDSESTKFNARIVPHYFWTIGLVFLCAIGGQGWGLGWDGFRLDESWIRWNMNKAGALICIVFSWNWCDLSNYGHPDYVNNHCLLCVQLPTLILGYLFVKGRISCWQMCQGSELSKAGIIQTGTVTVFHVTSCMHNQIAMFCRHIKAAWCNHS